MLRVILVDDEEAVLDLMERLLKHGNIEIAGRYIRPEEAIERVRAESIDVVFLDIQMPGMNGLQAAEYIAEASPETDIVFVTAYNQYAIEAFELSAVDYILKPPTSDRLNKTIGRLLRRRNMSIRGGAAIEEETIETRERVAAGYYCFGRFEWIVDANTGQAVKWRRSKERELMAYLVHHRNRFIPKGRILEELWPDSKSDHASVFLHSCIYNIRKKMSSLGFMEMLEYRDNGYRLKLREFWCDVDEFERIAGGNELDNSNIAEYERIVNSYIGDYMEEDGFVWMYEVQERLKGLYVNVMKRMAQFYTSAGMHHLAAGCLRSILQKNPYLDDANEMILKVYARMGDRQSMILHFERFANMLKEELGIAPMESTVSLYQRLCSGSASDIATA